MDAPSKPLLDIEEKKPAATEEDENTKLDKASMDYISQISSTLIDLGEPRPIEKKDEKKKGDVLSQDYLSGTNNLISLEREFETHKFEQDDDLNVPHIVDRNTTKEANLDVSNTNKLEEVVTDKKIQIQPASVLIPEVPKVESASVAIPEVATMESAKVLIPEVTKADHTGMLILEETKVEHTAVVITEATKVKSAGELITEVIEVEPAGMLIPEMEVQESSNVLTPENVKENPINGQDDKLSSLPPTPYEFQVYPGIYHDPATLNDVIKFPEYISSSKTYSLDSAVNNKDVTSNADVTTLEDISADKKYPPDSGTNTGDLTSIDASKMFIVTESQHINKNGEDNAQISVDLNNSGKTHSSPEITKGDKLREEKSHPISIESKNQSEVTGIEQVSEIGPNKIFTKCGLDTWFNPKCLNPTVAALIYWRDPKVSGIIFGSILIVLLSLSYFSLISVVANLGLVVLTLTIGFRIYKDILQAVQKTPQVHPLQSFLSYDISLPQEKVHQMIDCSLAHFNACLLELRRLFLVENLVDSIKFAIVLWVFSYIGAWFNGLTLVIIGLIALFSLPKAYESNKVQVDQNIKLVQLKLDEITNKIKEAMPAALRRRCPEKKE